MEDEIIAEGIFQKSREIDKEKQKKIVCADLNMEKDTHLFTKEILLFYYRIIVGKEGVY